MTVSRRHFLAGAAALPFASARVSAVPLPKDADIVVIGAGVAGIAAARRIQAANRRVVIIEATGRIGGRCETDMTTFGVPFDRGARWLHAQSTNPLARLARTVTMDVYPAPQAQKIRIGRRNARAGETEDFLATLVRSYRAITDPARKGDVSTDALPADVGEWRRTLEFTLGPSLASKDLKDVSALELARLEPRDGGAFCRQGVGALVGKLGEASPVVLSTPVTRIVWSGRETFVETRAGRVTARAIIVTASTNVLTSGALQFAPELPKRHLDAAAKLSLGTQERIAFELPGNPLGLQRDDYVIEKSEDARTALLMANLGGSSLCTVDVAGSFGRELRQQGDAAMLAFARDWLAKLYGANIVDTVKASVTNWTASPYIRGAVSAAAPGAHGSRRILMEPLGALFLAGEAAHETQWGTVGGAWESGERAADAALKRLGGASETVKQAPRKREPRTKSTVIAQ
jgi:monoamine oxidase